MKSDAKVKQSQRRIGKAEKDKVKQWQSIEQRRHRLEWLKYDDYECEENGCQGEFFIQCTLDKAIEIVRGGRNDCV